VRPLGELPNGGDPLAPAEPKEGVPTLVEPTQKDESILGPSFVVSGIPTKEGVLPSTVPKAGVPPNGTLEVGILLALAVGVPIEECPAFEDPKQNRGLGYGWPKGGVPPFEVPKLEFCPKLGTSFII
jgi:hypothetical protein